VLSLTCFPLLSYAITSPFHEWNFLCVTLSYRISLTLLGLVGILVSSYVMVSYYMLLTIASLRINTIPWNTPG
jgi:hypothetical protein